MEIAIFKEITTEGVITSIEENSKKYNEGLVANMDNLPERTMVKEGAAEIGDIIKELKTSRIAITKANTAAVNKEHDAIVSRLVIANKPYTDLLDVYNVKRKKELDIEKARKQAILDAAQKENDHEMALLIDKTYAYDKAERRRSLDEAMEATKAHVMKELEERHQARLKKDEQDKIKEENARLANVEHCAKINRDSLNELIDKCGLTPTQAKTVVSTIARKQLQHIQINY
ncbi:MAG TPA: hypothetical protein EYN54_13765 [Methylococcaceae bacterium]|nr:hypothetical protein [Methylococcaceae bacterium]